MTPYQQFCLNLDHHGGDANTGIAFAFIDMCREVGFEVRPRRTTITLARNGRTIVMDRWQERGGTVVGFRLHGDQERIMTVRVGSLLALARSENRPHRLRAMEAALFDVVEGLYLATEPVAA